MFMRRMLLTCAAALAVSGFAAGNAFAGWHALPPGWNDLGVHNAAVVTVEYYGGGSFLMQGQMKSDGGTVFASDWGYAFDPLPQVYAKVADCVPRRHRTWVYNGDNSAHNFFVNWRNC